MGVVRKKNINGRSRQAGKAVTSKKKPAHDKNSGGRSPFLLLLVLVVVMLDLYLAATVFLFRTGEIGTVLHRSILRTAGGGSLVVFLYILHVSVAFIFGRNIENPIRQFTGTIVLYFTLAVFLGLHRTAGLVQDQSLSVFTPGYPGVFFSDILLRVIGPLGAILAVLSTLVLSMALYGQLTLRHLKRLGALAGSVLFFRTRRSGQPVYTDPKTENTPSEHVMRPPEGRPSETETADREIPESTGDIAESQEFPPGQFPPPLGLFGERDTRVGTKDTEQIASDGDNILSTLEEFGVSATLGETVAGPTVIQYRLQLAPGVKVSKVSGLVNDIAVSLGVPSLRVEAPITGTTYVGIEIPNPLRSPVGLREILENESFSESGHDLTLGVGLGVDGRHISVGLEKLPHLLVAGTTGSGKSVFVSSCIAELCYAKTPDELRLLLIDPKRVEMKIFESLPHNLVPPVVDPKKAVHALGWAIREMEKRYEMFAQARVRNIRTYNARALPLDRLPYLVIVVDELADLMFTAPKEVEDYICRLAQMARATGIHLILATQRPSVNVVTGLIKANIPARVVFTLPSQTDSRTVIDVAGAEKLLGDGDMLFLSSRSPKPVRVQGPLVDENSIHAFIQYLLALFGEAEHIDMDAGNGSDSASGTAHLDDPLLEQAVNVVMQTGIASASRIQRQLRVGFTRAARLVDTMEQLGVVGPQDGSKPREILVDEDEALGILKDSLD